MNKVILAVLASLMVTPAFAIPEDQEITVTQVNKIEKDYEVYLQNSPWNMSLCISGYIESIKSSPPLFAQEWILIEQIDYVEFYNVVEGTADRCRRDYHETYHPEEGEWIRLEYQEDTE